MKGKVEVFAIAKDGTETLLRSEDNLIVDSAGESIVDMLTCPSSVLTVSPRVMDTSNWRIGAFSFGPAKGAFSEWVYPTASCMGYEPSVIGATAYYITSEAAVDLGEVGSWVQQVGQDHVIRTFFDFSGTAVSAYIPPRQLPSYPNPLDKELEPTASTAYSIVSGDGTHNFGQFENRVEFAESDTSSYFQGSFASSVNTQSIYLVSSLTGDFVANPLLNLITSVGVGGDDGVGNGTYNFHGDADYRGFVRAVPLSEATAGDFEETVGRSFFSGMGGQMSATDLILGEASLSGPRVMYRTYMSSGDVAVFNLFGGIHHIGLWTLDCKKSLENLGDNQAPPFYEKTGAPGTWIDGDGVTLREYKLFAKKTFTDNLCQNNDPSYKAAGIENHAHLLIKWTIDFRSKHD